jgi:hypothetical protein
MNSKHFEFILGLNYNNYKFSDKAVHQYKISEEAVTLRETYNLLYSFKYSLKPLKHFWNLSLALTDMDYFLINQGTNPLIKLRGHYNISRHLSLNTEASYKPAGFSNLAMANFGFTLKTGIIWNF